MNSSESKVSIAPALAAPSHRRVTRVGEAPRRPVVLVAVAGGTLLLPILRRLGAARSPFLCLSEPPSRR
jgi:hypothetical protein